MSFLFYKREQNERAMKMQLVVNIAHIILMDQKGLKFIKAKFTKNALVLKKWTGPFKVCL